MINEVTAEAQIAALNRRRKGTPDKLVEPSAEEKKRRAEEAVRKHEAKLAADKQKLEAAIFDNPAVGENVNAAGKHPEDPTLRKVNVASLDAGEQFKEFTAPPAAPVVPPKPPAFVLETKKKEEAEKPAAGEQEQPPQEQPPAKEEATA
jgi:hypothetical protein